MFGKQDRPICPSALKWMTCELNTWRTASLETSKSVPVFRTCSEAVRVGIQNENKNTVCPREGPVARWALGRTYMNWLTIANRIKQLCRSARGHFNRLRLNRRRGSEQESRRPTEGAKDRDTYKPGYIKVAMSNGSLSDSLVWFWMHSFTYAYGTTHISRTTWHVSDRVR